MYTAEDRERHIREWKQSGLNQSEYCRRAGIVSSTFAGWRHSKGDPGKLVRIDNLGKEVVIELRSGAQLKIPASESGLLKQVLEILNAGA
jgi:transposase-like protein